ncbi:flavin reductase family protein [Marinomonas sp. A79]|uniref:Flavin reductase family protein n=1 Tax=Marinomonas vulgaris TaxID=2823372 RepID=A0ABS5HC54_9GAMM|nr:flavin reductase family protein [Marinomonas vulgaris]MBR7888963.1 flavin reductase family protein [Marinomonas vulgaris]
MRFQFDQLNASQRYHLITQTITPRPIAWILTKNENASFNLAPFSYFAPLSPDPALLAVSIGNKATDVPKDTKRNLIREQECVLHIPSGELAEAVNESAASTDYNESELPRAGLSLTDFVTSLPRIAEANIALHCRLYDIHSIEKASFDVLYLEIIDLYVSDHLVSQDNNRTTIDNQKLNPLSRLGGNDFALLGDIVTIQRPN